MTDQLDPPRLITLVAEVECVCGEVHEFDDAHEGGWPMIFAPCDCGRALSVQFDEPILQYEQPRPAEIALRPVEVGTEATQ